MNAPLVTDAQRAALLENGRRAAAGASCIRKPAPPDRHRESDPVGCGCRVPWTPPG